MKKFLYFIFCIGFFIFINNNVKATEYETINVSLPVYYMAYGYSYQTSYPYATWSQSRATTSPYYSYNGGFEARLRSGYTSPSYTTGRILININTSEIPINAIIASSTLFLTPRKIGTRTQTINIHLIGHDIYISPSATSTYDIYNFNLLSHYNLINYSEPKTITSAFTDYYVPMPFILNTDGKNAIAKATNTQFAIVEGHDFNDIDPKPAGINRLTSDTFYFAGWATTTVANQPHLDIQYLVPLPDEQISSSTIANYVMDNNTPIQILTLFSIVMIGVFIYFIVI